MHYKTITQCRISGSNNLIKLLDLGAQPLANSLQKRKFNQKKKYPLSISYCKESSLLQLNETINKSTLFKNYIWVTGTSKTAKLFAKIFFKKIVTLIKFKKKDFIIEIASNDGTFLKEFKKYGYKNILGVDPAQNIAEIANKKKIKTIPKFWSFQLSNEIKKKYGEAKIIFARNVISHVNNVLDVIKGINHILKEDGLGIIEFHYAGEIQKKLQYDSIYHEHLCYFSIESMRYLLKSFELYPFHIDKSPISGGALLIFFSKREKLKSKQYDDFIKIEEDLKINKFITWKKFSNNVVKHRKKIIDLLSSLKNKNIIGFGSSARSQTFLNYCNINSSIIKAIIDNNKLKQDLFTPGSSIPIVDIRSGLKQKPGIIFILAWNFKDEIAKICINSGFKGKFLVAFPNKIKLFNSNEIY